MKYIAFLATPLFFLFLTSEIFSESCDYSYNPSATSVQWTAYKFTEKTGVKGTFKKITVTGQKKSAASIEDKS
ncbi:MAG: hypothetical protein K8R21_12860 [Leptospira sp.]|nr:hypothetical protein [Leptospira sp.]